MNMTLPFFISLTMWNLKGRSLVFDQRKRMRKEEEIIAKKLQPLRTIFVYFIGIK